MNIFDVSDERGLAALLTEITRLRTEGKKPFVRLTRGKRTLDQNAAIYTLYREIAHQKADMDETDVRRHCKLILGVPLIFGEPGFEPFTVIWSKLSGILTHDEQLQAMDYIDVTSLFEKEQATAYIDAIIRHWGENGIYLELRR